ncbi:MAG TPA: hypothetical protein GX530_07080 [Corynebacteriales bacterium]|jgi:hypothetical protein|nr:hypothetical protein [Mycobacteriales bacterium]
MKKATGSKKVNTMKEKGHAMAALEKQAGIAFYSRTTELLDKYRMMLTGNLDSRNDPRMYDFIYKHQPNFQSEILDFIYLSGYIDGRNGAAAGQDPEKG